MGVEKHSAGRRFDLRDLGVLEGPPLRGAETVVNLAVDLLNTDRVALLIFDDATGSVFARAVSDGRQASEMLPMSSSVASLTRGESLPVAISDVQQELPDAMERTCLGGVAVLSVPVFGPDIPPAGTLVAIERTPREWTKRDIRQMENLAYLVSQEIILRASFATLRIISRDRSPHH